MKTDVWGRSRSVLALAAGVASKEIKHQVRSRLTSSAEKLGASEIRARIEQAMLMAESMGRLKGAFMKAGQLLSIDASDLLPPEATEILSKLQSQAEPVDFAILRGVLEEELTPEALATLVDLDPVPVASASIGQVHRARVNGAAVAVKIQYPGIAESIDSDIALLEKLGSTWMGFAKRQMDLKSTFDEMKSVLHLEADYARERGSLEKFRGLVGEDARFYVPASYPELSSSRVLTMSWADGLPLHAWIRTDPPREARQAFGRTLLDLYCLEFFTWGLVQTDPNFGNFLVRPNENGRIVLLDFGASLPYDDEFRTRYVALLRAVATKDEARIIEESIAFGVFDARESAEARARFAEMLTSSVEPFESGRQPFAFRDDDYAARSRDVVQRFLKSLVYSPPPRQLIFLHRKLGGIFQLLRRLDVELDLRPYWEKMIEGNGSGVGA